MINISKLEADTIGLCLVALKNGSPDVMKKALEKILADREEFLPEEISHSVLHM